MAKGDDEYQQLLDAMNTTPPNCEGDGRFIAETVTEWDLVQMRGLCRTCPIRERCLAYAQTAKPTGGFWAGKHRRGRGQR